MKTRAFVLGLWLVLAPAGVPTALSAQADAPTAFDGPLPAVAAYFRREVLKDGKLVASEDWRLWRDGDRLVTELPGSQTGEIWQREGKALIVTRLFHAHRRGIEYQPGDMGVVGAASDWDRRSLVVDPDVLRRLSVSDADRVDGLPLLRYQGTLEGANWDVTLRQDLMVPTQLVFQRGEWLERITLLEGYALAATPWHPTNSRDYDLIDFADLGDRERDPFVLAIQSADGVGHGHAHQ